MKTRQEKFLELFPDAPIDENGVLAYIPCIFNTNIKAKDCTICKYNRTVYVDHCGMDIPCNSCDKARYWNEGWKVKNEQFRKEIL